MFKKLKKNKNKYGLKKKSLLSAQLYYKLSKIEENNQLLHY
jgi:hypothetical protein